MPPHIKVMVDHSDSLLPLPLFALSPNPSTVDHLRKQVDSPPRHQRSHTLALSSRTAANHKVLQQSALGIEILT